MTPRRTAHTSHQLYNTSTGQLGELTSSGDYTEACRLIRVDGVFRVASDMYNEYMNLLATDNGADSTISDYVPTAAATKNYQDFILDYLETKFVGKSSSTYNTSLAPTGSVVTDMETEHNLNVPTTAIEIARPTTSSNAEKWLHDRGLYVDYLEDEASQAVIDAENDCTGTAGAEPTLEQKRTCVLKVLPFTTINLTELADWLPASGSQIVVSNNDFRTSLDSQAPVRGKVVPGSKPTPSTVTNAVATIRKSNSGVAVMRGGIDADDAAYLSDSQPFQPAGSWAESDTDAGSGGTFTIQLSDYDFSNVNPTFGVTPIATCNPATSGTSQPNPFTCTTQYIGDTQKLTIANYNYQINAASSATLTCTGGGGDKPYPGTSYTTKTCRNYAVSGVTLDNVAVTSTLSVSNSGSVNETTAISLPAVVQGGSIVITFGSPTDTVQTPVCTYNGNKGDNLNQYNITVEDCP